MDGFIIGFDKFKGFVEQQGKLKAEKNLYLEMPETEPGNNQ